MKRKKRNVSVWSVNERIFHIGESLERKNIRARCHKCKIKPERLRLRVPWSHVFARRIARANRLARGRGKTYREFLSAAWRRAPAYPHFLDNEQIARSGGGRPDPHLTVWFPAIDRLDRLITRHVAQSHQNGSDRWVDHGAHFWSTIKNIFPSSLRCNRQCRPIERDCS